MSISATLSPSERSYIISGLAHPTQPTRLDGRTLQESRPVSISYGDAPQASGSARVVLGGTEVLAGIRLEVGEDGEGWKCPVEVDVTPQAYPQATSQTLSLLSTQLASVVSEHFVPSVPPIAIVPQMKYFIPHLHLTALSTSGNLPTAILLASRAAFQDLRIPKTKVISTGPAEAADGTEADLSGIKAAVRAGRSGVKGKGKDKGPMRGIEWELDQTGDGLIRLQGVERLPILVTLNLIPGSQSCFLDATLQEESACPDRLHAFFTPAGKVCGLRIQGDSGLEIDRIRPLLQDAKKISSDVFRSLEDVSG